MNLKKNTIIEHGLLAYITFLSINTLFSITFDSAVQMHALAIQADANIVAVGSTRIDTAHTIVLARYLGSTGNFDTTFGTAGIVTSSIGSPCSASAIALDGNNNIVVGGLSGQRMLIARYLPTGALDTTFGSPNGYITTASGDYAEIKSLLIDGTGNIVVAGISIEQGNAYCIVARYTATGALDTTFGSAGIFKTKIGNRSLVESIALQSDGSIILAGWASIYNSEHIILARLTPAGQLDTSFGTDGNGIVITAIGSLSHAHAVIIQADDTIVVAGNSEGKGCIARYTASGSLDSSNFNSPLGYAVTSVENNTLFSTVGLQADNKIIVAGQQTSQALLMRYTSTGAVDTNYNSTGSITLSLDTPTTLFNSVKIRTDAGHIGYALAAGSTEISALLACFSPTGLADTTFGDQGYVLRPGPYQNVHNASVLLWDEKTSGTPGGSAFKNQWTQRALNKLSPMTDFISLTNNQFTLQPGVYTLFVTAPFNNSHQSRIALYNVTDNVFVIYSNSDNFNQNSGKLFLEYQLMVFKETTYDIRYNCKGNAAGAETLGIPFSAPGTPEIYTFVKITKL